MEVDRDLETARRNREGWNQHSAEYQSLHDEHLRQLAWGVWRIPEADLDLLGDTAGKDVLELGCGGGQWSVELARLGTRTVGIDNSERQLAHARRLAHEAGVTVPFVHGPAERLPFHDATFDVVFCDYGAMTFADPRLTVPEAARVLRQQGIFVFSNNSPILWVCWPAERDEVGTALELDYFEMELMVEDDGIVSFQLPYGEWIRLFRDNGLTVESLVEPRPPPGASSPYEGRPVEWARRWPTEVIWKLRKTR